MDLALIANATGIDAVDLTVDLSSHFIGYRVFIDEAVKYTYGRGSLVHFDP